MRLSRGKSDGLAPHPPLQNYHGVKSIGQLHGIPFRGTGLIIGQTGVGRAVFDMFRASGLRPKGCTITAGENETWTPDGWRVAKLQLVGRLQAMLHSGQLEIAADLPDLAALKTELQNFRVNFTAIGNMAFAARVGAHDDLVLAVAIAIWYAEHRTHQRVWVREFDGTPSSEADY